MRAYRADEERRPQVVRDGKDRHSGPQRAAGRKRGWGRQQYAGVGCGDRAGGARPGALRRAGFSRVRAALCAASLGRQYHDITGRAVEGGLALGEGEHLVQRRGEKYRETC